jgi:hypothetical protein
MARALEDAVQQRDAGLAETAAAALLRLEPCHEAGHAARMAARALCRDASGVEDAYFACASRLRDELGVRPSQRLEAAYAEAIGAARAAPMRLLIEFAPAPQGQVAYAAWGQGRDTVTSGVGRSGLVNAFRERAALRPRPSARGRAPSHRWSSPRRSRPCRRPRASRCPA